MTGGFWERKAAVAALLFLCEVMLVDELGITTPEHIVTLVRSRVRRPRGGRPASQII